MEYDPAGRRVLLLGGATSPAEAADLWSWDGGRWLALQPRGVEQPPARRWHALAFDPVRGRALLFGGAAQAALGDTWEWDGEQWERTAPDAGSVQPVQPGARSFHAMATDLLGQKLVLFGGHAWSGLADLWLDDTWEWDGWTWSRVEPPGYRPTARSGHAMAGVGQEGMVALFGGYGRRAGSGTRLADLWLFDGSAWSEQQGEDPQGDGGPAGRNWHALSYDTQRGRLVLFGGRAGQLLGDTWEWDGRSWRDCSPGPEEPAPAPRDAHAMAFDPRRGRVVLHGGRDLASAPLGDLWEWDGARWQLVPAGANRSIPPPRLSHGLAWDESSGAVLLYGGSDGTGTVHGDLWAWDGATWRELSSPRHLADGPRPRLGHAVAADPHGQKLVAFGGHAQQIDQRFADTWEWSAAAGERPAQVARVALGPLVGSRPVEWLELGLWLRAGGLAPGASGMGEGANLYLWEQGCWEEAARGLPDPELPPTTPGDPGLGTLQWSSVDPERIAGLLFGPEQDLACALTPAGPNGPGGGRIASDYLELRVRMRRVP
ncbi:MAG: hypothetical protein FJ125_04770 [Deltaproteobacteria bacterium]|nr:hypothetical protein [Deltaproteobacteria bacterium]